MQTSAFTDEDLKRFKEEMEDLSKVDVVHFIEDIYSLLARLEAAETLIMAGLFPSKLDNCGKEAFKAWCKAAGRGRDK